MQMAKSTMRSELGKLTLEEVFQERARLNERIMDAINEVPSAEVHGWMTGSESVLYIGGRGLGYSLSSIRD